MIVFLRRTSRSILTALSELSDIPYGPCQGFYVAARSTPAAAAAARQGRRDRQRQREDVAGGGQPPPQPLAGFRIVPATRLAKHQCLNKSSSSSQQRKRPVFVTTAAASPSTSKRCRRDEDDDDEDPFVDRETGRINFDAIRASITSPKPLKPEAVWMDNYLADCREGGVPHHRGRGQSSRPKLVPERRLKNITDREEGVVVQYLTLGGYRHYMCSSRYPSIAEDEEETEEARHQCGGDRMRLARAASALHAGAGQQTFGWNKSQRADLLLVFVDSDDGHTALHYHNHHEFGVHYTGHVPDCWRAETRGSFREKTLSRRCDSFREGLARAFTSVRPDRAKFFYTRTTTCELLHGSDLSREVPSTLANSTETYATALETCLLERTDDFIYQPPAERGRSLDVVKEVVPAIAAGRLTGFVTIKGGRETLSDCPAADMFGFCMQKYSPTGKQVSPFTRRQIADYHGFETEQEVDKFIDSQLSRTVNSGTFHTWETVTTSYLRWLMNARGFAGFRVKHLAVYNFTDDPKHFLEPILQRRHDAKRRGRAVEAECLKLIGNGSFGYNGLEATNYTSVRLLREASYKKLRYTELAHRNLKHTTLLSLVRDKVKAKRGGGSRKRKTPSHAAATFLSDEAAVDDDDDADDDDDGDAEEEEGEDDVFENREVLAVLGLESERDDDDDERRVHLDDGDDDEGACDDAAVARQDARMFGSDPNFIRVSCLYAVDVSGEDRQLFNNLPKAVAVLGNSKRLFFSHLLTMFQCLDPALAELCYVDTDSCLWSFSYESIEDCLLKDKLDLWRARSIVADEESDMSCHGKMKLEGVYKAGLFRTAKIYRLFDATPYTRCKGVNRHQANRLLDRHFDVEWNNATVIHRTCLKPTRTGEIVIAREAKRMSVPFNLKRYVTDDGIHTAPFSKLTDPDNNDHDDDDDDRRSWTDEEANNRDDDDENDDDDDDDDDGEYSQGLKYFSRIGLTESDNV